MVRASSFAKPSEDRRGATLRVSLLAAEGGPAKRERQEGAERDQIGRIV